MLETRQGNFSKISKKIGLFKIKEDEGYNEYDNSDDEGQEYSGREKFQVGTMGLAPKQSIGRSKMANYNQPRGRDFLFSFNTQYGSGFGNFKNSSKL